MQYFVTMQHFLADEMQLQYLPGVSHLLLYNFKAIKGFPFPSDWEGFIAGSVHSEGRREEGGLGKVLGSASVPNSR